MIEYISNHAAEMQKISFSELSGTGMSFQKQIHRVLTPEKRYSLWQEKFKAILAQNDWTDDERNYLHKFNDALNVNYLYRILNNLLSLRPFLRIGVKKQ